jgi:hypothetical protein
VQWRERDATGFGWEPRYKHMFIDFESMIEDFIGAKRISEKKMDMYKGTLKKWQILDEKTFDPEQIAKMQASAKAPSPELLDLYEEKHDRPMTLPITNENVSNWRDPQRAIDTADFDPKFIEYDRERNTRFFNDRYQQPLALTSS